MHPTKIYQDLTDGGLINPSRANRFNEKCRDALVPVFRDSTSGIIYIDPGYCARSNQYYKEKKMPTSLAPRNDMDIIDTERRAHMIKPFIASSRWLDFGCGPGYLLANEASKAKAHLGLDLNSDNITMLNNAGFNVSQSLESIHDFSPELITMFHVLEHLDNPTEILRRLRETASTDCKLIVEVPHARDWLLLNGPQSFRDFTLWSEHLILHTRESLSYILSKAGWSLQYITGIQRYPVWNHLSWFTEQKPTGYSTALIDQSCINLQFSYETYLAARDQTDTLVAIAHRN